MNVRDDIDAIYMFSAVSFLYLTADYIVYISSLWTLAKYHGNPFYIGMIVCLGILMPSLTRMIIKPGNDKKFTNSEFRKSRVLSSLIYLVIAISYAYFQSSNVIYVALFFFSIINLATMRNTEAISGILASDSKDNHTFIARMQQATAQISMLCGAGVAGYILNSFGYPGAMNIAIVSAISGVGIHCFLSIKSAQGEPDELKNAYQANEGKLLLNLTNYAFIILLLSAAVVSLFNFIAPFLLSNERNLSANDYGLLEVCCVAGSMAGVAAYGKLNKIFSSGTIITVVLLAALLIFSKGNKQLIFISGFMIGFSLNMLRIRQRAIIFENTTNVYLAHYWGDRISKYSLLVRSGLPLLLGYVLKFSLPSEIIITCAVLICFLMLIFCYGQKGYLF